VSGKNSALAQLFFRPIGHLDEISGGDEVRRIDFSRLYYHIITVTYKNHAQQNVSKKLANFQFCPIQITDKLGNGNAPGWLTGGAEEVVRPEDESNAPKPHRRKGA
jgi:hypothetical protein